MHRLGKVAKEAGWVSSAVWVEGVGWNGKLSFRAHSTGWAPMRMGFTGMLALGGGWESGDKEWDCVARVCKATCRFGSTMQSL